MGDSLVYFHLSSALAVAIAIQLAIVRSDLYTTLTLLGVAVVAIATYRGYSRARELAADAISAGVVGDDVRNQLSSHDILDVPRVPVLAFHPSVAKRIAALDNVSTLFTGLAFPYLALGAIAVVLAGQLNALLASQKVFSSEIPLSVILVAGLVGGAVARTLSFGTVLRVRATLWWLLCLAAGSTLTILALAPSSLILNETLRLVLLMSGISVAAAALLIVTIFAFWVIGSLSKPKDEINFRAMGLQSVIVALVVASLWASPIVLVLGNFIG